MSASDSAVLDRDAVRAEWLSRLSRLMTSVESWAQEFGWSTRRIDTRIEDSQIGEHHASALLMQAGTTRVLLEPIARSAPGVEGVVDLYRMPRFDDIASLFYYDGGWHLHYAGAQPAHTPDPLDLPSKPVSKEALKEVLDSLAAHAA